MPNEILIQWKAGVTDAEKANARGRAAAAPREIVAHPQVTAQGDLELAALAPGRAVADAARDLQGHPAVLFAEPNWIYHHQATATDTYYGNGSLWGMYGDNSLITPGVPTNQYGSQAEEAWELGKTGSKDVYVGVIDEGIQYTHPDLAANIWTNPFDPADGIDNDGNGYVDDIRGWDFDGNNNTIYDGGTRGSLNDHGTHVAGTIGATGGNGTGVVGVNWNVTMISGKFLGRRGGTTANAIKAVDYFTGLKTKHGLNIVATNNSWGGGGSSQGLYDAIERANKANILFVAAAGNGGSDGVGDDNDKTPSYPASYTNTNIIAVAAIDSSGGKASFSNFGATSVDLGALGVGIWSTTAYNGYSSYNGTSMATPHVTGAAALYASVKPGATAAQIKSAILSSAVPTAALAGETVTGGRLNASANEDGALSR